MKIEIKEIKERTERITEIKIELPYYTTSGIHFFRFDENQDSICVLENSSCGFSIEKRPKSQTPESWYLYQKTTKEEFEAKFNEVIKLLQNEIK